MFAEPTERILTFGAVVRSLKASQSTGTFLNKVSVCGDFFSPQKTQKTKRKLLFNKSSSGQLSEKERKKERDRWRVLGFLLYLLAPVHSTPSPGAGFTGGYALGAQSPVPRKAPCLL